MTFAYAVIEESKIDVATVSLTQRATKVNWLVVHHLCPIYQTTTDEQIEEMWEHWSGDACVRRVNIVEVIGQAHEDR